jgi:hypothetical protein
MKKLGYASMLAAAYLSMAALAQASTLTGSQVTLTGEYPTLGTALTNSVTETVAATFATAEFTVPPGFFLFGFNTTVGADAIDISYNGDPGGTAVTTSFDGYVFAFTGAPAITGVSLDPSSTFTSSQIGLGFTADEVSVNLEGQTVSDGSYVQVDVSLAPTASVPEPQSYALILAGLGVIGIFRLRKA